MTQEYIKYVEKSLFFDMQLVCVKM